jgi:hypothetical protein
MDKRYAIERARNTGLLIVSHMGVKIGSAQTLAAARLIRSKHRVRTYGRPA